MRGAHLEPEPPTPSAAHEADPAATEGLQILRREALAGTAAAPPHRVHPPARPLTAAPRHSVRQQWETWLLVRCLSEGSLRLEY